MATRVARALVSTLSLLLAAASGCSSSDPPAEASDVQRICTKLVGCGLTDSTTGAPVSQTECEGIVGLSIYSPACVADMLAGACKDVLGTTYDAECYPPCADAGGTTYTCSGSVLTICESAQTHRMDCVKMCASETITGKTGGTFDHCGPSLTSGHDACLCNFPPQ